MCGMIAHKLNYKPKRLTALDASTQLSHLWSSNFMGTGWNNSDAAFIDYYKSSIMAGTNKFKGNNNFVLIESDGGFEFSKFSDSDSETYRHGYSIDWFAQSIINTKLPIGYRLSPNYISNQLGNNFSEEQYHGVINGTKNRIENFTTLRDELSVEKNLWNYTEPWYGKKKYQGLFNDNVFQNAFATTIEYAANGVELNGASKDYLQSGTKESVQISIENRAENSSVPLDVRLNEVQPISANTLFITKNGTSTQYVINKDKDGYSQIKTESDLYILGYNSDYYNISKSDNEQKSDIEFTITSSLWDKIAEKDKDSDFIYCDLWLIAACDKQHLLGDWYNSSKSMYYPLSESGYHFRNIKLTQGELYSQNNIYIKRAVKVRNPKLACSAGDDMTVKLKKNEEETNITLFGQVTRDQGKTLSYYWEKAKSVFSKSKEGNISLGVGKHRLTFRITAENSSNNTRASSSSEDEAEDDVVITVEPYTPGDDDEESTSTASSWDPNEKVSIKGAGSKSCVKPAETMEYTIFFENDAEMAQLAAQTVTVIDTLDVAFDLSTFEFTGAKASNNTVDIPNGLSELCIYTDMRPNNDLILKTDMKLDTDNRIVTVVYSSLDTLTNEPTQDVFAGFLPPNDSTHVGEGCFSYRVKLKENVPDGYDVKNQAHIFFDYNDEIATNITSNYVDNALPKSYVEKLPLTTSKDSILVKWTGQDEGAGIKYYDVYCSKNGDSYYLWKEKSTENSSYIKGEIGDKYEFFSIATDSLNYVEEFKKIAEATIEFVAPQPVPNPIASLDSGTEVYRGTKVQFDVEGENMKIWYTLDGSSPLDENGTKQLYLNPIRIDKNISIRAVAENEDGMFSEVVAYDYYIMQSKAGVPLNEGWTWISFNMKNEALSSVNTAFASGEWTSDDVVKDHKYVDMYSANQKQWIGTLSKHGALNNTQMYKVRSPKAQTLGLTGEAIHPLETTLTVGPGWNYISYLPMVNMSVTDALKGYKAENGDVIKSQDAFATYSTTNGWEGDLTTMTAGRGYMLKRGTNASQVSFTYPVESFGSSVKAAAPAKSYRYADNMNIIGEVEGINVEDGDSLVAYVNGEIRGASRLERNHKVFLTIQGDEDAKVAMVLVRDGEIIATASNMIVYQSNNVLGTSDAPTAITFVTDDSRLDGNVGNVKAIYGINGIKMNTRRLNNIPSGTYIIYSEKNGNTCVTKFIK